MVHLHFGPSVLYRDCFTPPALRRGQSLGCSVVNRLTRRMGLSPMNNAPFAGCCGGCLFIERRAPEIIPFVFQRRASVADNWSPTCHRAPLKNKKRVWVGVACYKQATTNVVKKAIDPALLPSIPPCYHRYFAFIQGYFGFIEGFFRFPRSKTGFF